MKKPGELPGDREAAEALALFEAGDTAGALQLLDAAIERGVSSVESIEPFLALTSSAGIPIRGIEAAERFLADDRLDIAPIDEARLCSEILLAAIDLHDDVETEGQRVLASLQAAAAAGPDGWRILEHPVLREIIVGHLRPSQLGLDLAEQLLFAPVETGWPEFSSQQIETIGLAAADDADLARAAERLLHSIGMADAAYEVQRARQSRSRSAKRPSRAPARKERKPLTGMTVAIAGGHPALRATIGAEVVALGGTTREIPSRFEAVRRDKDILDVLGGSDVVVTIIPQIAHSTSDQIKRAAGRLSVPVILAPSASVRSIVNLALRWCEETSGG